MCWVSEMVGRDGALGVGDDGWRLWVDFWRWAKHGTLEPVITFKKCSSIMTIMGCYYTFD